MPKKAKDVVVIPPERVEVMQTLDVEKLLPNDSVALNAELPASREECMKLILCNSVSASRFNSIRKWHIGRIIVALDDRAEENVMEEAMTLTGYKRRELQHAVKLYRDYPDSNAVLALASAGLEMIQFKQLGAVRNPDTRKLLAEKVTKGEMDKEALSEAAKSAVAKEKAVKQQEKEAEAGDSDTAAAEDPVVVKVNYKGLYARTEEFCLQLIKNIQLYEKEHVDMLEVLGDPTRVQNDDFDTAMGAFEDKVEKPLAKAIKELTAMRDVLVSEADKQVQRGKAATEAEKATKLKKA